MTQDDESCNEIRGQRFVNFSLVYFAHACLALVTLRVISETALGVEIDWSPVTGQGLR